MAGRVVHVTQFGAPATLEVSEAPIPTPGPGEVVVKMLCAPVNPADIFSLMGIYPAFTNKTPAIPGLEGVGVVHSFGDGVWAVALGQRVVPLFVLGKDYLSAGKGSWSEYVVFKSTQLIPVPDGVSDEAAAQFVVNPWTAYAMIKELAAPAGEYLIQSAAGSVLGRQFIQMARALGFKTINIVRRADAVAELKASTGAEVVLVSGVDDIPARVKEITGGKGAWGGVDCVGGDLTEALTGSLRNGGTLLLYGTMGGVHFKGSTLDALFRDVRVRGFWVTPFLNGKGLAYCHSLAAEIWPLFTSGAVTPYVGTAYPIERVSEAVTASQEPARGGKVMLKF